MGEEDKERFILKYLLISTSVQRPLLGLGAACPNCITFFYYVREMVSVLGIWNIMPMSRKCQNADRFLILLLQHAKLSTSVLLIRRVLYKAAKGQAKTRGRKNSVSSSPLQHWSIPENIIQLQGLSCRVPETNQVMQKHSFWEEFFTASEQNLNSNEAQNHIKHRIFWIERNLLRALSPTPQPSRVTYSRLCRTMSRWGMQ